jgi:hypothetical protein
MVLVNSLMKIESAVIDNKRPMIKHVINECFNDALRNGKLGGKLKEELIAVGIGSKQKSGNHVLFIDLDGYSLKDSVLAARKIINNHACSTCYIIQSSKETNHHLVCLDLFRYEDARNIAKQYGHDAWIKFRGYSKDFVLRVSPKILIKRDDFGNLVSFDTVEGTVPFLSAIVKSPFSYRPKCNSLREIFSTIWDIKIEQDRNFTDDDTFRLHAYRIRNIVGGEKE